MKIKYEIKGDFGFITLSNPPLNYIDSNLFKNPETLENFLQKSSIKGVIIKGEGKHFCNGVNPEILKEDLKKSDALPLLLDSGKNFLKILSDAPIPAIAVIKGGCIGAGLEIALSCHFRFAASSAILGFPETDYGILPGLGGTIFCSKAAGLSKAIELILTGKLLSAEDAKKIGIVDEIFDTGEVESKAIEFLKNLTGNRSIEIIKSVIKSINNSLKLSYDQALNEETKLFLHLVQLINEQKQKDESLDK